MSKTELQKFDIEKIDGKRNRLTIQGKNVIIDISQLLNEEVLYINATPLAKQFGKRLDHYMKNHDTKEYIEVFNSLLKGDLELVKTVEGRYGGTYIHNDLAIHFFRWLDVEFAVKCDIFIKETIQNAHDNKIRVNATVSANLANDEHFGLRTQSKETNKNLKDIIKDFCLYAENEKGEKYDKGCPMYVTIAKAIYQYMGLEQLPKNVNKRDYYTANEVELIEWYELMLGEYIELMMKNNLTYKHIKKQTLKHLSMINECKNEVELEKYLNKRHLLDGNTFHNAGLGLIKKMVMAEGEK